MSCLSFVGVNFSYIGLNKKGFDIVGDPSDPTVGLLGGAVGNIKVEFEGAVLPLKDAAIPLALALPTGSKPKLVLAGVIVGEDEAELSNLWLRELEVALLPELSGTPNEKVLEVIELELVSKGCTNDENLSELAIFAETLLSLVVKGEFVAPIIAFVKFSIFYDQF